MTRHLLKVSDFSKEECLKLIDKAIEIKKNDEIRVMQLWAEGLPWWVYEEGPFRKSWLVGIEE